MKSSLVRLNMSVLAVGAVTGAGASTFGNTSPFEMVSSHSQDYVLGVQVVVPQAITLQSFGLIYGIDGSAPATSNAIFGLYSSNVGNGLPDSLVAVTNPINLNTAQTYDNIAFTSTPTIGAGTYWMMALYESFANPRMSVQNSSSLVAYWYNSYSSGMPGTASSISTYTGQNFNYWVNGSPVPEPTTMAVLGLGALVVAKRRRRS